MVPGTDGPDPRRSRDVRFHTRRARDVQEETELEEPVKPLPVEPRHVRAVTEWPMSTSKIQKFKLREIAKEAKL